jgi:hypothetical protein
MNTSEQQFTPDKKIFCTTGTLTEGMQAGGLSSGSSCREYCCPAQKKGCDE